MPKRKSFYSQTVPAPAKKLAGTNPVGSVAVGPASKLTVPAKPATVHGLGPQAQLFRKAAVPGAQKYGYVGKPHKQNLKLSGHAGAHQLGSRGK